MTPWERKLEEFVQGKDLTTCTALHVQAAINEGVNTEHEFRLVLKAALMMSDDSINIHVDRVRTYNPRAL